MTQPNPLGLLGFEECKAGTLHPLCAYGTRFGMIRQDAGSNCVFQNCAERQIFSLLSVILRESGDAVPRTPWDFSLWACTGSASPGLVGRRAATSCRLQGHIGARGASPQCSILRCDLETLSWVESQRQLLVQTLFYAGWASGGALCSSCWRSRALRQMSSLRITAVRATFLSLPALSSRW